MSEILHNSDDLELAKVQRKLAFGTLKQIFGLAFDDEQVPLIDNKRVKSAASIDLADGGTATATLFDHFNGKGSQSRPVEERLLVTIQKGVVESKWEVSEAGLKSFNTNVRDIEIHGQKISLVNPWYPFGGWVDDRETVCPEDFNNLIGNLLSVFEQTPVQ